MRLAREIERRLERLVEGATAAVFRGRLHPVDVADRLVRQLEFLEHEGFAGPEIPNHISLRLSPTDLDPSLDTHRLEEELASIVEVTAADRGWRLNGPAVVEVGVDPSVPRGMVECEGTTQPGLLRPWGQLISLGGGGAFELRDNRVIIGRSQQCDIVIAVPEVSRQHAAVVRSAGGHTIGDLGSSNGTYLNGGRLGDDAAHLVPGDEITVGDRTYGFRTS